MDQLLHALKAARCARVVRLLLLGGSLGVAAPTAPTDAQLAEAVVRAYPDAQLRADADAVVWPDGTRTPVTRAGATSGSYTDRLNHADLRAQLRTPYPACAPLRPPAYLEDPGRARDDAFFRRLYGSSSAQVSAHLRAVNWFGQRLAFTTVNGADRALEAVARDLAAQLPQHPDWRAFLTPSAGTFLWRTVAGTPRLSAHSYGIAIDLNTRMSAYWQWDGHREGARGIPYRNRFPAGIVHTFERHGFVWGGRWYHYDTMHFEYRPELARCP
ncbi:M15 family metallopeptidase [Deinococcus maricopensis]|uniref:Peptidase M15C domain-containing protein n=1 Tax=Deinococcus maricopensis (strain DSM 21211 / LMG 22137 / NRRL B-23946 / LB-34) TaxID=709986 RepID=E8U9W7_DEIML|nr:M15 family metallopeptidase [Deinococcus maricopensis]ADV67856.1 hypothetical protein Deima_2217 [Deinococcus maricopensis DSM 21211]